jgi:hypothetical protein
MRINVELCEWVSFHSLPTLSEGRRLACFSPSHKQTLRGYRRPIYGLRGILAVEDYMLIIQFYRYFRNTFIAKVDASKALQERFHVFRNNITMNNLPNANLNSSAP